MKERSLVVFTLLAQLAVGVFWVSGGLDSWPGYKMALLAAPVLMALGMLASFFHLGSPLNAWRAFSNLRSSWLSREVLCSVLFAGASGLVAALEWFELAPAAVHNAIVWTTALLGLALISSMANAYRARTVPAWDTWATPISFFTTSLLLGGLAVGAMLAFDPAAPTELIRLALRRIAVGSIVLLGVQLIVVSLWLARLAGEPGAAARAAARVTQEHRLILRLRFALAILGMAAAGIGLFAWGASATILAFVLVLASEVLGRVLFYEARERYGV